MQLLKSISDHLLSRPPQPPPEPSHPIERPPSPPFDAASERPVRNALALGESPEDTPFDQQSSNTPSYANSFRPDRKPDSVRRVLRSSIPHPGLGMPKPSGGKDPTRGNASSSSTFADELRLFPGGKQQDPDGVRVIPGQTFGKKANIPSGFKPWDTISRGAKGSGPVRASGKERSFFNSQSRTNHTENNERSSKRRRVESPEETRSRISISDDDAPAHSSTRGSPVATRSNPLSSSPNQFSGRKRQLSQSNGRSEYRTIDEGTRVKRPSPKKDTSYLDRFSSEDHDLSFTRDAAKQRRRESNGETDQAPRKLPAQSSNLSVEIPRRQSITPRPRQDGKARLSYSRESPDELQGEVTVGPVPTSLNNSFDHTISDIRPTVFAAPQKSKHGKGKKGKGSKKGPASQKFTISYYRGGYLLKQALGGENDHLLVDPGSGDSGEITTSIADSGYRHSISMHKVRRAVVGEASSCKIRFELSKSEGEDTRLDFEISTAEEKGRLCSFLRALEIDVQEKEGKYIENVFEKSARDHNIVAQSTNGFKRPRGLLEVAKESSKPPPGPKRMKLSDGLKAKPEDPVADTPGKRASPSLPATEKTGAERAANPSSHLQHNLGVEIPVKKSNTLLQPPTRATRSMSRQAPTTLVCDDDDEQEEEHTPEPNLTVDQKWNRKPLVYPRFGKKKAEVNALDLERLAPHEFLNDNIIGFYIRFLEDHLQRRNAEAAKRVYFFNSYFFATLTNSPRGRRNINYEGVAKWTRHVDLFSYDYVIVPINENAHWYIAIIANLPRLEGIIDENNPPDSQPNTEVQEVPETPEPEGQKEASGNPQTEETARKSLASMSLLDQGPQAEGSKSSEDDWPERGENPDAAHAKSTEASSQPQPDSQKTSETTGTPKKNRKAKKRQSLGMKYDISQPIVITFDSLNQGRSSTISTLREYLYAEAKSKRGIDINKVLVKGMTAKEIPQQPNFSDCGLYLLAYVEKFVQNPDLFVRKLLRKEMRSNEDWPPLRSGLLRSRLHKFMELLYLEQEQLTKVQAEEETLMVDQQPISYLLGTTATDEFKKEVEDKKKPEPQIQVKRSPTPEDKSKSKTPDQSREPSAQPEDPKPEVEKSASPPKLETQDSVICIENPASPSESPNPEPSPRSSKRVIVEVPDSQEKGPAPMENTPRQTRPHAPGPKTKCEDAVYVEDSDGVEEYEPQRKTSGVEVQVQVSGTPPKSP